MNETTDSLPWASALLGFGSPSHHTIAAGSLVPIVWTVPSRFKVLRVRHLYLFARSENLPGSAVNMMIETIEVNDRRLAWVDVVSELFAVPVVPAGLAHHLPIDLSNVFPKLLAGDNVTFRVQNKSLQARPFHGALLCYYVDEPSGNVSPPFRE